MHMNLYKGSCQLLISAALILQPEIANSQSTKQSTDTSKNLFRTGFELLKEGQYRAAEIQFRKGLSISPNTPLAHYYLGEILVQMGQIQEAVEQYALAIRYGPNTKEAALAEVKQKELIERLQKIALEREQEAVRDRSERAARELEQSEREHWATIANSTEPANFQRHLERYPNGQFAVQAQEKALGPARLIVYRPGQFRGRAVNYALKLRCSGSSSDLGEIANGTFLDASTGPGNCSLEVFLRGEKRAEKSIHLKGGQPFYLSITSSGGNWGPPDWHLDEKAAEVGAQEIVGLSSSINARQQR